MELKDWADLATVVTALVAVGALCGAVWQVYVGWRSQREATASALYAGYLALAVEHPRLAGAYVSLAEFDDATGGEFERYEWFVSVMLHAAEQILELTGNDEVWRATIRDQVDYHREYLSSERFNRRHYSAALCQLMPSRSTV